MRQGAATRGAYRNRASNYSKKLHNPALHPFIHSHQISTPIMRLFGIASARWIVRGSGLLFIEALSIDFRGCHVTTDPIYRTIWLLTH